MKDEEAPAVEPDVTLYKKVFGDIEFDKLTRVIAFAPDEVIIAGRTIITKRQVAFYSESGQSYRYSGTDHHPRLWPEILRVIKEKAEQITARKYNACLANLYGNGEIGMGWHSDNERELGENPAIASISFGAARKFSLRSLRSLKTTKQKWDYTLEHGDLLLMHGNSQQLFEHTLRTQKNVNNPRINLTFRFNLPLGKSPEKGNRND